MNYPIKIINQTKFLWLIILSIAILIPGKLALSIIIHSQIPMLLIFPILIILFILFQSISSKEITAEINQDTLTFMNKTFFLSEIDGILIQENISMSAFCFRLKSGEIIQSTLSKTGKWKARYTDFTNDFKTTLRDQKIKTETLHYTEIYPKSGRFIKSTVYIGIPLIIALDVFSIVMMIWGEFKIPYQLFFANVLLVGMVSYAFKKKK